MNETATIYRMVTPEHICPFGIKAKDLLRREGVPVRDRALKTREETERFQHLYDVDTTPQIFIGERRIGGYEHLRQHFGLQAEHSDATTRLPLIALLGFAGLITLALIWRLPVTLNSVISADMFAGLSMCVLAILKLQDLVAFTDRFVTYDLLASRWVPYAYIYPFAEAFVGLGMLSAALTPWVSLTALFIGSIGTASVVKAVYIDRRDLKCACVGGSSKVPLGALSLSENLAMVLLGGWMLLR